MKDLELYSYSIAVICCLVGAVVESGQLATTGLLAWVATFLLDGIK